MLRDQHAPTINRPNTSLKVDKNRRELRYPNESTEYREARELLLKEEKALVDKTRAVAEMRRNLPRGGELKEDYVFQWAKEGNVGERVKFSELFGDNAFGTKQTSLRRNVRFGSQGDILRCQLLMFSVLQFTTAGSRAASPAGATRQYSSRVPPQRFGIGVAQISARQPDINQHPVVEVG
jgi:hypothetical protein